MRGGITNTIRKKLIENHMPYDCLFELTPRCTMNCKMCYVVLTEEQQKKIGEELTTKQWLDLAQAAVDMGVFHVLLSGGEPLIRPDFFEILEGISSMGVLVRVNSNATMITPKVVEKILKCPPTRFNISLYGGSNETYEKLCGLKNGYDIATRGIELLCEAGIPVKINFTGTNLNYQDRAAVKEFAEAHKIPVQASSYVFELEKKDESLKCSPLDTMKIFNETDNGVLTNEYTHIADLKKYQATGPKIKSGEFSLPHKELVNCTAGRSSFCITWNGKMTPCVMLRHITQEPLKIGFKEAWENTWKAVEAIRLPKKCTTCEYALICHACAAQIYESSGRFDVVDDELCKIAEEYAKSLMELDETQKNK